MIGRPPVSGFPWVILARPLVLTDSVSSWPAVVALSLSKNHSAVLFLVPVSWIWGYLDQGPRLAFPVIRTVIVSLETVYIHRLW